MIERKLPVAVFCSSGEVAPKYKEPARQLGKLLAQDGFEMIYGGTDSGLMKVMADTMQENGGGVIGVVVSSAENIVRKNADQMLGMPTLGERKATMIGGSLAVVGLVGGIGTLDEIAEAMAFGRQVILLNTDGFYNGLRAQLERMNDEGFFPYTVKSVVQFADTPEQLMDLLWDNIIITLDRLAKLEESQTIPEENNTNL